MDLRLNHFYIFFQLLAWKNCGTSNNDPVNPFGSCSLQGLSGVGFREVQGLGSGV